MAEPTKEELQREVREILALPPVPSDGRPSRVTLLNLALEALARREEVKALIAKWRVEADKKNQRSMDKLVEDEQRAIAAGECYGLNDAADELDALSASPS